MLHYSIKKIMVLRHNSAADLSLYHYSSRRTREEPWKQAAGYKNLQRELGDSYIPVRKSASCAKERFHPCLRSTSPLNVADRMYSIIRIASLNAGISFRFGLYTDGARFGWSEAQ